MENVLAKFNCSGRTTRMIEYAAEHHPAERVLLMFAEFDHANSAFENAIRFFKQKIEKVVFKDKSFHLKNDSVLCFRSVKDQRWEHKAERYEGYPSTTPIYIDHHYYEIEFRDILEKYHRWDAND